MDNSLIDRRSRIVHNERVEVYRMSKTYLIDLDGTMYQGTKRIDGAKEFVDYLLRNKHDFVFFTNNSSRTPKEAKEHMESLGFEGIKEQHFFTSALASAKYVKANYKGSKAYMVGQLGLQEALQIEGFQIVNNTEEQADFVFIGLDKQGNYEVYSKALRQLLGGAILVGTNNDRVLLQENGANVGNGSIVAMFEYASNQKSLQIGKPHRVMIDTYLQYSGKTVEECVIIGDNLETDIACGNQVGMETILVESGIHTEFDCERLNIYPSRSFKNLYSLMNEHE